MDAGADISALEGDTAIVPIEYARKLDCQGMVAVLEKSETETVIEQPSLLGKEVLKDDVLRSPWKYISLYRLEDIAWLKENSANLFGPVTINKKHFSRVDSFSEAAVVRDLTEVVLQLGSAVRYNDSRFTQTIPVDKWTLEIISQNQSHEIPKSNGSHWDPDRIKSLHDLYTPTNWDVEPMISVACHARHPNMAMLRLLVEHCGADINAHITHYTPDGPRRNGTVLHTLASSVTAIHGSHYRRPVYWHIEALRYLVSKGADIHARDLQGRTPLHLAYGGTGAAEIIQRWFVQALLDLGADPTIKDNEGRTYVDVANSV